MFGKILTAQQDADLRVHFTALSQSPGTFLMYPSPPWSEQWSTRVPQVLRTRTARAGVLGDFRRVIENCGLTAGKEGRERLNKRCVRSLSLQLLQRLQNTPGGVVFFSCPHNVPCLSNLLHDQLCCGNPQWPGFTPWMDQELGW